MESGATEKGSCDDAILLDRAQEGDRAALEALLAAHRADVFRYGLRVCPTTEDAEDAVQHTLWSASRSIAGFRRASSVATWLFTIVRNRCLKQLGREPFYADLDVAVAELADPRLGVDEEIVRREVGVVLSRALASLSTEHREVLVLRDVQGLTAPEAAAVLGIGVPALKSRLHRARAALRDVVVAEAVELRG